jgi:hypothetical protein
LYCDTGVDKFQARGEIDDEPVYTPGFKVYTCKLVPADFREITKRVTTDATIAFLLFYWGLKCKDRVIWFAAENDRTRYHRTTALDKSWPGGEWVVRR